MFAKKCICGAVTVTYENKQGQEVTSSMPLNLFNKHFPDAKLETEEFFACDYCINHWGIDLCGCGSGEKVGKCDGNFEECKSNIPMQTIGIMQPISGWRS